MKVFIAVMLYLDERHTNSELRVLKCVSLGRYEFYCTPFSTVPTYKMLWRNDDDRPSHLKDVLVSNVWLGLSSLPLIFTINSESV